MAQLSQDCFASGAAILSVDDAVAAIVAQLRPVDGVDTVALVDADGRVLAEDLLATLQLPPFTNSAVDGYAVRGEDLPTGDARSFRVAGRLQAGSAAAGAAVAPGEAVRIFTGAPMPAARSARPGRTRCCPRWSTTRLTTMCPPNISRRRPLTPLSSGVHRMLPSR